MGYIVVIALVTISIKIRADHYTDLQIAYNNLYTTDAAIAIDFFRESAFALAGDILARTPAAALPTTKGKRRDRVNFITSFLRSSFWIFFQTS
ncbi:MAG: hypothetical protein AN487_11130 [Anabaena sp. CRKS33]|jgi:hypothetical protein|nr:MAG: hypothetical protein AN487_11130 [Anabaena sp. CRKS33]